VRAFAKVQEVAQKSLALREKSPAEAATSAVTRTEDSQGVGGVRVCPHGSNENLEKTITRYIAATNRNPKPFVWTGTATAKAIRTKLALNHPFESVH
jgi:hypothetical protein